MSATFATADVAAPCPQVLEERDDSAKSGLFRQPSCFCWVFLPFLIC